MSTTPFVEALVRWATGKRLNQSPTQTKPYNRWKQKRKLLSRRFLLLLVIIMSIVGAFAMTIISWLMPTTTLQRIHVSYQGCTWYIYGLKYRLKKRTISCVRSRISSKLICATIASGLYDTSIARITGFT